MCEKLIKKYDYFKNIRKQKKLFGTFGFRGVVNEGSEGINTDKVKCLGRALATYLGEDKTIAIGKDPRLSSDMLEKAFIDGIIDNGCNTLTLGIITPSTLSLEVRRQADAGVMITASHNPPEYNGVKCINNLGMGFSPEEDIALEKIYFDRVINKVKKGKKGKQLSDNGGAERYGIHTVRYVKNLFPTKPMKIVVDGCGGSASLVTPDILERLGHKVVRFNCQYDGLFRERNPEPKDLNLEKLKKLVLSENADMGIAHDGDGDRTAFVDENGKFVQGDISAAIIAHHVLQQNNNKNKKIAVTIAFSNIIEYVAKALDTKVIYTPVGEPYLAQAKLICNAQIGLEEHGSVLLEWSREGPMLAGMMAGILSKEGKGLAELVASYPRYHQIKDSKVIPAGMDIIMLMDRLKQEIPHDYKRMTDMDGIRVDYPNGWFLVRASGTEPKVRIFSEGMTEKIAMKLNNGAMEGLERAMGN